MEHQNGILHDEASEMAVLGAAMQSPSAAAEAVGRLTVDDFLKAGHKLIFQALKKLAAKEIMADLLLIGKHLGPDLAQIGGPEYLTLLTNSAPMLENAPRYIEALLAVSLRRRVQRLAQATLAEIALPQADSPKIVADMFSELEAIQRAARPQNRSMVEILTDTLQTALGKKPDDAIPTGLLDLDDYLDGGFRPGRLYIVAGRPGMGKSSFCSQVTVQAAAAGIPAAIFSFEMSADQFALQMICSRARVNSSIARRRMVDEAQANALIKSAGELSDLKLFLADDGSLTIDKLAFQAADLVRSAGVRLIVVDYLQLIKLGSRRESRQVEITEISAGLKTLAKRLNVAVLAAAQLNRQAEGRENFEPRLSDLRESGSIEQDADAVILLHRPGKYAENASNDERQKCNLIVAKNREGRTGGVDALFMEATTRFVSLSKITQEDRFDNR